MTAFHETADSSLHRLEVTGTMGAATADQVFAAFTRADLITQWWGQEAEADPVVGGALIVRWPAMDWTFRGTFTEVEPSRAVGFTWAWDHEPDTPARFVRVILSPTDGGTDVTVSHGEYGPDDAEERRGHLEGWLHFFGRIQAMFSG